MSTIRSCGDCSLLPDILDQGISYGDCEGCASFPPDGFVICDNPHHTAECRSRTPWEPYHPATGDQSKETGCQLTASADE